MIPSAYRILSEFPRTNNGKTDRKALLFDFTDRDKKDNHEIESLTPAEKIIYDIWCDALKTKDISATDNFFNLGGNSLLAISVFSKIESAFEIKLNLRVFFDSPRIRDLGETIKNSKQKMVNSNPDKKNKKNSKIIKGKI